MAEKQEQPAQGYPLAPAAVMPRSDAEYVPTNYHSQQQMKRKKRMRCLAYVAVLAIIQAVVIAAFILVIVRVRTPRVRLADVRLANGNSLTARVSIRNRNFGRYEYDSSLATVMSGNTNVGSFEIRDARVRARSTRRFNVVFPNLNGVMSSNSSVYNLSVEARLQRGKVRTLWVIKRNRAARLSCTMTVNLSTNDVRNLRCQ